MAIHQEIDIGASPDVVYAVLTRSDEFARMTGGRAADIARDEGGAISLFGGDIEGRNIELVPGRRIVQAWRSRAWPEGVYSIIRFELAPAGKNTRLVFDQAGHPEEASAMLEGGWHQMYWQPMNAMVSGS
ncbi:MAG: SRPBCC domain-containing protein [Bauldia sp.]|nr:SRPBCC domain-containing protein [Bauldia sp.]